ncbi:MAG: hypothetical protein KJO33_12440 [Gammaproteobacteria bacterium]|nr:hypothetical protein [Gammaproteobacteria bacterium]
MAKKSGKRDKETDFDLFENFDDLNDDEMDLKALTGRFYHPEWEEDFESGARMTARRTIERRRDMRKLYSQFDDWEEIGEHVNW